MERILSIYCCGGMGREIADMAYRINNNEKKWSDVIFVDDTIVHKVVDDIEVYTLDEALERFKNDNLDFIVTAGEPIIRQKIYEKLSSYNLNYIYITYPGFELSRHSSVNCGTIIHTGTITTCNVHIGVGCLINKHVVIGHDVKIDNYCVISPNVTIGGNAKINEKCYIGSGAIIRNGITIGSNSIIGMGAVVLKDVPPNSVMVGNPAKLLRYNNGQKVFDK